MLSMSDRIINLVGLVWYKVWKGCHRHEITCLVFGIVFIWLALASIFYFPAWGLTLNFMGLALALIVSGTIILFLWVFIVSWEERKKQ